MGRLTQPGAYSLSDQLIPLILSERPTAYYLGKEISGGVMQDLSGNGFNLTANGAPDPNSRVLMPYDPAGRYVFMDTGANSYILAPTPPGIPVPVNGSWSVLAIVCPLDISQAINLFTICGNGEDEPTNFQVDVRIVSPTGFDTFWEHGAGVNATVNSNIDIELGVPVVLACCKDTAAQIVHFYRNGIPIAQVSYANPEPTGGTNTNMAVGDARPASVSGANIIGHVAFYNGKVLTPAFVADVARAAGLLGAQY